MLWIRGTIMFWIRGTIMLWIRGTIMLWIRGTIMNRAPLFFLIEGNLKIPTVVP